MKGFAKSYPAKKPRSPQSAQMAILMVSILVVMILGQLFTFDEFLALLATFNPGFSMVYWQIFGAILVTVEVFALPFLLRMQLSVLFRWVSMVSGWLVTVAWTWLSVMIMVAGREVDAAGIVGALPVPAGWWMVPFSVALGLLMAWASWGLWPGKLKR